MNVLTSEWNLDDAIAYRSKEAYEDGYAQGLDVGREDGIDEGREEGLEKGREEGLEEAQFTIARNLLNKGSTPEFVCDVTGVSLDSLKEMQADL